MDRASQRVVQEAVSEVAALCPWMNAEDVAMAEEVFRAHVGLVAGEVVDLEAMGATLLVLAQRAEEVGDVRRAWGFDQWYRWTCASMRGEEYHWPALPAELVGLV